MTNAQIAESMSVYVIWVKKLQFRYRNYTSNPSVLQAIGAILPR